VRDVAFAFLCPSEVLLLRLHAPLPAVLGNGVVVLLRARLDFLENVFLQGLSRVQKRVDVLVLVGNDVLNIFVGARLVSQPEIVIFPRNRWVYQIAIPSFLSGHLSK